MPIIDEKMIKKQIFDLISEGQFRKNTGVSISFSKNDAVKMTKSDFLEILYKYLPGEIPTVQNAWARTNIRIPQIVHQKFIHKYFGAEQQKISDTFSCDEADCFDQFSSLVFSMSKLCNSRKALENLRGLGFTSGFVIKTDFFSNENRENSFVEVDEGSECHCDQQDLIYGIKGKGCS